MTMKNLMYFVVFCSSAVFGFLAQDGSTGSMPGTPTADDKTIQNLLNLIVNEQNSRIQLQNLIVNEQNSRIHLQNLVTTLSDEIDRLEKTQGQSLTNVDIKVNQTERDMAKKLNEMNARLVQMERFNAEVSTKLEKEKNNREHLEQMYAALEQRLNNCTASDGQGKADLHQTESSLNNLTNSFTALRTNLTDINNKMINLTQRYEIRTNEFNANLHNLTASNTILDGEVKTIDTKVGNISLVVEETNKRLENISNEIRVMKGGLRQHASVGFSVYTPDQSGTAGTILRYQKLIYNTGNGYNMSSGVFTCFHPGLYFFTSTSFRLGSTAESDCFFFVNNKSYTAVTSGYAHASYLSGTQSIVTELKTGDRVYLSNCGGIAQFYRHSSFSGFLISSL